jgi:hypothetical protein
MTITDKANGFNPNHVLGGPDANQPEYLPLPVQIQKDVEGEFVYTSAWSLTPEDLERLQQHPVIFLHILGGQPPVLLSLEADSLTAEKVNLEDLAIAALKAEGVDLDS